MKDQISALMDNELDLDDSVHLFTAIKSDEELGRCWSSYHLIGDAMRGTGMFKSDFNRRLMQKLEAEPTIVAPHSKRKLVQRPVLWSAAASVAAVMFVGWMVLQQQSHSGVDVATPQIAQNVPSEYLLAHQALSPSSSAYYIQPAAYTENGQ